MTDVSQRKLLEQENAMALKVRALGEWSGDVAHDLRNLLAGMIMCCDLLAAKLTGDGESQIIVNQIMSSARSAEQLTGRLLMYGRVRNRPTRKTNLNELIRSVTGLLKRAFGPTMSVQMDLGQNIGEISVDPIEMEEVLINLAFNARHAMPEGGDLTFETRCIVWPTSDLDIPQNMTPGRYVLLSVRDRGTGMDEATAARAFEPFFTTKAEGHGTGLGLWTVHRVVTQSEGYIGIDSIVGRGTNVRILLPASNESIGNSADIPASGTAA